MSIYYGCQTFLITIEQIQSHIYLGLETKGFSLKCRGDLHLISTEAVKLYANVIQKYRGILCIYSKISETKTVYYDIQIYSIISICY